MNIKTVNDLKLSVDLRPEEYRRAALIASRRIGTLRPLPVVTVLAAALLFIGLSSINWFSSSWQSIVLPLAVCAGGPFLLAVFFILEPANIRERADREFRSLSRLTAGAQITLGVDDLLTQTPLVRTNEPYALMASCVETPEMFVLIRDRDRLTVLPKRCFPADRAEDIDNYLRHMFSRRRTVMKNWIF